MVIYWNYIWLQNIIHTQVGSDGEVGLGDFGSSGVVVVIRGGVVVVVLDWSNFDDTPNPIHNSNTRWGGGSGA